MRARLIYVLQDTFLDAAHAKESFPGNEVEIVNGTAVPGEPKRPFKVAFPPPPAEPEPAAKVRTCERLTTESLLVRWCATKQVVLQHLSDIALQASGQIRREATMCAISPLVAAVNKVH